MFNRLNKQILLKRSASLRYATPVDKCRQCIEIRWAVCIVSLRQPRYTRHVRLSVWACYYYEQLAQIARITTVGQPVGPGRTMQLASTNKAPLFTLIKRSSTQDARL